MLIKKQPSSYFTQLIKRIIKKKKLHYAVLCILFFVLVLGLINSPLKSKINKLILYSYKFPINYISSFNVSRSNIYIDISHKNF